MKLFPWDEKTPDDFIAMSSYWRLGESAIYAILF